jgi:hypothetical protein
VRTAGPIEKKKARTTKLLQKRTTRKRLHWATCLNYHSPSKNPNTRKNAQHILSQ